MVLILQANLPFKGINEFRHSGRRLFCVAVVGTPQDLSQLSKQKQPAGRSDQRAAQSRLSYLDKFVWPAPGRCGPRL